MHELDSEFARGEIAARSRVLTDARAAAPRGEFVLYWMQAAQRFEENWALRAAVLRADELGLPLLVYQGLDPTYPYASDRVHGFILDGARELAARADSLGVAYRFSLRRRRADDRRVVDRIASRAALVVTDDYPTAGVAERVARFAERASCPVIAVDSVGVVPASRFPRAEYAARTIRPKVIAALDLALEPVRDRAPRRAMPESLLRSLDFDALDLARVDIDAELARCEIDHEVPRLAIRGGLAPARARLRAFVGDGLDGYGERRREPTDDLGSSRLSPWLHFGMIAPAEVVRATRRSADFLDEMVVWRELALNLCVRTPRFRTMHALPEWARRTLAAHDADRREAIYSLAQLENAATGDALWNAAQMELRRTGVIHNAVRQLWGKSLLRWTQKPAEALKRLIHLNDRWAIDGRDPNSYANILWCLGKFDRPFAERAVWGMVRPMMLERARAKFDVDAYIARHLP